MFDIVFAHTEKEKNAFMKQAQKLGFDGLLFLEDFEQKKQKNRGVLINATNKAVLRKQLSKAKSGNEKNIVIMLGSDDEINREAIESRKIDILLSPEHTRKNDFTHYRNSGLNDVLCNLAKANNIAIAIDFNGLNSMKNEKEKALRLGRIMQNIRICSKTGAKMIIASFSKTPEQMFSARDLRSFCLAIGMNTKQAKEALSYLGQMIKAKKN